MLQQDIRRIASLEKARLAVRSAKSQLFRLVPEQYQELLQSKVGDVLHKEKAVRMPFIQLVLELCDEQRQRQQDEWDWEALRSACEEEGLAAREKALRLAQNDRMEAYQQEEAEQ